MRPEITSIIESHLDKQLGLWTRLLPWRREIAIHLEQAYEASQADTSGSRNDDSAWQMALADFGDVQSVASGLRKEHWPQYIGWRVAAIAVSLAVVFSLLNPLALLDLPALGIVLGPMIAFIIFDTFRGSTRWALANRIGTWGGLLGAIIGTVIILTDWGNPAILGSGSAISILSALYCVIFFSPRQSIVIALFGMVFANFGLMLGSMHFIAPDCPISFEIVLPRNWSIEICFVKRVLMIGGVGICLGITRFGFHGLRRHALTVAAGIFLLNVIMLLSDMNPSTVIGGFVVSCAAMVFAIACCHLTSDSSRFLRRIRG